MSNNTYMYAEFVDHVARGSMLDRKNGKLMLIGEPDEDLIRDFHLKKDDHGRYLTSFRDIAETGWRLKFVTPCGYGAGNRPGGAIENAYVFEKVNEYVELEW